MREVVLDTLESVDDWTVFGNDTINLATTVRHIFGTTAMEFDKANGTANTKLAGAYSSPTARNIHVPHGFTAQDEIRWYLYVSAITNVDYSFIRVGTSSSHYVEYRYYDRDIRAGRFTCCRCRIGEFASQTGNGVDWSAIEYVAIGVAFDAETDTLADIAVQRIEIVEAPEVNASQINSESDATGTLDTPAPTVASVIGGVANAAAPTRVEGATAAFSMDLKGGQRVKVDLAQVAKNGDSPTDLVQIGGISTTAAPTYTTAKANPLSLTTGGALRSRVDTAQTTIGGDAAADLLQVGTATTTAAPTYTTAKQNPISTRTDGGVRVAIDLAQTTNGGDVVTNGVQTGALANAAAPTIVEGKLGYTSMDLKGGTRVRVDLAQAAPAGTDPGQMVLEGGVANTGVPTAVTNGQTVRPWRDEYGRTPSDKAYDPSSGSKMVTPTAEAPRTTLSPPAFAALTAAGATVATDVTGLSCWEWQVVVASLETGQFCGVTVQCSADNSSWANADDSGMETIFTASGTYLMRFSNRCSKYVKLNMTTDSVGGAVTVTGTLTAAR